MSRSPTKADLTRELAAARREIELAVAALMNTDAVLADLGHTDKSRPRLILDDALVALGRRGLFAMTKEHPT